jgi:hypothetical protein
MNKGCRVEAVDQLAPTDTTAGVKVHVQDLDAPPAFSVKGADHILLLDVIEHLKDPERFLERLRCQFDHTPKTVILTTPNIAFLVQRLMLLFGQFNYGKAGILDRTHTRLFTFRSLQRLLSDGGFVIEEVRGIPAPFPKALGEGFLGRALLKANEVAIAVAPGLFSYQIFVKARTTPDVHFVLADTKKSARLKSVKN